jgi:hypothetical protein
MPSGAKSISPRRCQHPVPFLSERCTPVARVSAAVLENPSRLFHHGLIDQVLHPIVGTLHVPHIVLRGIDRNVQLFPLQARGHGPNMFDRHAPLPVVDIFHFR